MNEIFNQYLKDGYKYKIDRAVISKDRKSLTIEITLNFILTEKELNEIKGKIIEKSGVEKVILSLNCEDVEMCSKDIVSKMFPTVITKLPLHIEGMLKSVKKEDLVIDENKVVVHVMGESVANMLNSQAKHELKKEYKDIIQIDLDFDFVHHEEKFGNLKSLIDEKNPDPIRQSQSKPVANKPVTKEKSEKKEGYGRKRKAKSFFTEISSAKAVLPIKEIHEPQKEIVIEGTLFKKSSFLTKIGSHLLSLYITDGNSSIMAKAFLKEEFFDEFKEKVKEGDSLKLTGDIEWDNWDRTYVIMAKGIMKTEGKSREDNASVKRVELHAHTKMSSLDGLNDVDTLISTAKKWGHEAIAITDHGVVQAFPDAYHCAKGIKVIYGLEGYLLDDKDRIMEDGTIDYKKHPTNHIIILAKNEIGIKNIYKLVSTSHIDYFYKKPRIPKSILTKYREGLILGTACEAGELYQAILNKKSEEEIKEIADYYDYLEIQPLTNNYFMIRKNIVESEEELIRINKKIVRLGEELGKPVVATCDTHYTNKEDGKYRDVIMAGQGYKDVEDSSDLYLRTTEEMLEEFSYLGEDKAYEVVVTNTNFISQMIENVSPLKKGKFPPKIEGDKEELRETCERTAKEIYGEPLPELISERLERELNSIISNGYAVMYISAKKLVDKSMEDGYLVGSRGSVGSSFAATMSGITEVNPLPPHYICPQCKYLEWGDEEKYECGVDLPQKNCPECGALLKQDGFSIRFETFLGFEGDKEPDIDLNFAGEYQAKAHKYVEEIFGPENVYKAGTIGTIAEKTAFGFAKKYFEERGIQENKVELERLTLGCLKVKRTTGQHPGGIIIVPRGREIYEFCPINYPANKSEDNIITTHFDYHSIDSNLLKLDILGHDAPSMIRWLELLTGVAPDQVPLSDEKVASLFLGTEGLDIKINNYKFTHGSYGIPEFGTKFVRQMLDDTKPKNLGDLIRISGLSHGTDVWINNAQEFIKDGKATIDTIISTRDDIMNYLIIKGLPNKQAFDIMENVRKGKGLKDHEEELMVAHNVPDWYIESCKRIKYMFPRAHAAAYVVMAYRIAYFKVYYPAAFYAVYLTTKLADFNWEVIKKGINEIEDRINNLLVKGKGMTKKEEDEITVLEICYEMYARGYEFMYPSFQNSYAEKFDVREGKVVVPLCALEGIGENAGKILFEENKTKPFRTVDDVKTRGKANKVAIEAMRENEMLKGLPEADQISFFELMGV